MVDARRFIDNVRKILASHYLGAPGEYRRWNTQNAEGTRDLGPNEYGTSDAANILYMIRDLPADARARSSWIDVIQGFQHADSGMFVEKTHPPIHTTAYCIGALDLFDARPKHAIRELEPLKERAALEQFLDRLDWVGNPWGEALKGSGVFAALVLSREVPLEWQDWYFDWLWKESDPDTGLLRRGCIPKNGSGAKVPLFNHMAGTFHYMFNMEYAGRPLHYPARIVDTCIRLYDEKNHPPIAAKVAFTEADWIYALNRSFRRSGHRFDDSMRVITAIAEPVVQFLDSLDPDADDQMNDLHLLIGSVCALAEIQAAVPGLVRTEEPLRQVLDRRPFV